MTKTFNIKLLLLGILLALSPVALCARASVISTDTLMEVVQNQSATLIDCRGSSAGKSIPNAEKIDAAASDADIKSALPDKNATLVLFAAGPGSSEVRKLHKTLTKLGYKNIFIYREGVKGWKKAGGNTK